MPPSKYILEKAVADALAEFYLKRINKLDSLKLSTILRGKNPYMFCAIGIADADEFIDKILNAYVSSSEETLFGNVFFEPVAKAVSDGIISPSPGVDVAIETMTSYKAIAIKSGTRVFNVQSRSRQNQEFISLRSRLHKLQKHFDAVVGYCYGRKLPSKRVTTIFREVAGQELWKELTGDSDFYTKLIDAMGDAPIQHREEFNAAWGRAKNRFLRDFTTDFCKPSGEIDWKELVKFNCKSKANASQ